jgi:membrane fusion protein (multidrug efflux system)
VVSSLKATDVIITQRYLCQIHSHCHINVRASERGILGGISVTEGQAVKKGDLMFKIGKTKKSFEEGAAVSQNELKLHEAKPARAQANANLAKADLDFGKVVAPFGGIVGRLREQLGSLIKEGDVLTTLSDNSVVWVYFNVPEKQYLEYMARRKQHEEDKIELVLANGNKFPQIGTINAIQAQFNNGTGNIPFRADFPNPDGLLRHGQSGTILIHRTLRDATVIPVRATYEILDKRYVYVVDKDDVVHQREIAAEREMDDIFVIKEGVGAGDRIVLEGIRQLRDGEKVEYEFRPPHEVMRNLKFHAD